MAIAFDTEGLRPGEEVNKGFELLPAGHYHCQVDEANEKESENCVELKCQIVSPGPCCGRTFTKQIKFGVGDTVEDRKKSIEAAIRNAIRLGLTTEAAYEADRLAARPHPVDWAQGAPGAQFVCNVVYKPFKSDRTGEMVPWNQYYIEDIHDDKARAKANCDPDLLVLVEGLKPDNPFGNPPQQQAAAAQPVAAGAAPAAAQPVTANGAAKSTIYDDI